MYCLIRSSSAFMEYEHREALIFSPNKLALQSIANRVNPFTDDNYAVIAADGVRKGAKVVIYCHHNDSDINYSILNDDAFFEDTAGNAKRLNSIITPRLKENRSCISIKQVVVKNEITKADMAEVFCQIGAEYSRPVLTYNDFCCLEVGYKRLRSGKNSPEFYGCRDFANSLSHFHGFDLHRLNT